MTTPDWTWQPDTDPGDWNLDHIEERWVAVAHGVPVARVTRHTPGARWALPDEDPDPDDIAQDLANPWKTSIFDVVGGCGPAMAVWEEIDSYPTLTDAQAAVEQDKDQLQTFALDYLQDQ